MSLGEDPLVNVWDAFSADHLLLCDVSLAFFISDAILDRFNDFSLAFLLHHTVSISSLLLLRYELVGGPLLASVLVLAETTNVVLVPWLQLRVLGYRDMFSRLSPAVTTFFVVVRGLGVASYTSFFVWSFYVVDQPTPHFDLWWTLHACTMSLVLLALLGLVWSWLFARFYLKKKAPIKVMDKLE